jgi:hypothetical protein
LRVGSLFSECFDCDPSLVFEADSQVDGCEVALAQSFFCLEKVMKIVLIHDVLTLRLPLIKIFDVVAVKLLRLEIGADKLKSVGDSQAFILGLVLGTEHLEDGVKADHESLFGLFVLGSGEEDGLVGEDQGDRGGVVRLQVKGAGHKRVGRD